LLKDAAENYPAWLAAIGVAAERLEERARAGVRVRLLGAIGLLLLGLSIVAVLWPPIVVVPFAVVGVWVALALLARAWRFTKEVSCGGGRPTRPWIAARLEGDPCCTRRTSPPRPEQPNG